MSPRMAAWAYLMRRFLLSGWRWAGRILGAAGVGLTLAAAEVDEARAHEALSKMFQDGLHEYVERDAATFATQFPASTNLPGIVLLRAQSRVALRRYDEAVSLLAAESAKAGALADEYAFWQAEARLRKGEYGPAAEGFARLTADFPASARRIEAAVQEAVARLQAGDPAQASARLRDPAGPFQTGAAAAPGSPWAQRGHLLLARLLIGLNDVAGAEQALTVAGTPALAPALEWERQLLFARADFAAARLPEVLGHTTNLWTAVTNGLAPELLAEAGALEGRVFEGLQQTEAAIRAYDRNLATNLPVAHRRFALQKVVELSQTPPAAAALGARLQGFIETHPQDELLDLARMALGEAQLRDYTRLGGPGIPATPENLTARTNLLAQARAQFELVLANHPQSSLAPRAEFQRAWTLWEEGAPRLADALAGFRNATARLTAPPDQARARLQWAECQVQTGDLAGALTNFWLVATNEPGPAVPADLRGQALFSVVRTSIDARDLPGAAAAAQRLNAAPAIEDLAQRAELLVARAYTAAGQPEQARAQYEGFLQRHTNSVWIPDVRLAIARTFEQRGDNGAALSAYASWLANFTNQPVATNLVAQATFDLARVTHRVSADATSVALLTNFIARFPGDPNAPRAQFLVADQWLNDGEYARAELAFQDKLFDPAAAPPGDELPYRARLMAGKAAVYRQGWQSAREHFDWLITNGPLVVVSSKVPVPVLAEAYIFRGDLFTLEPRGKDADPLAGYAEAINAFAKVAERFPTNELAPRAWGRIGDCHFQLASADPKRYAAAAEAYQRVLESPGDSGVRSMAEVALGLVLQKQAPLKTESEQAALLDAAMAHLLNVFYGRNLRAGELPYPAWLKQAGLYAAQLAESRKQWEVARGVYQRLITELPPLAPRFERRLQELDRIAGAGPR